MAKTAAERQVETRNKNAGRQKELRKRMRDTLARYETVFGKALTVNELREYLANEERHEKLVFMRDRMGVLSGTDIKYLRQVIDEKASAPDVPPALDEELEEFVEESDEETDFDEE